MLELKKLFKTPLFRIVELLVAGLLLGIAFECIYPFPPFIVQFILGMATYHWILKPVFSAKKKEEEIS